MRMQPISFELCIQCFFKFSLMHNKEIQPDFLFVFMLYNAIYMFMFTYLKNSCFSCWNR